MSALSFCSHKLDNVSYFSNSRKKADSLHIGIKLSYNSWVCPNPSPNSVLRFLPAASMSCCCVGGKAAIFCYTKCKNFPRTQTKKKKIRLFNKIFLEKDTTHIVQSPLKVRVKLRQSVGQQGYGLIILCCVGVSEAFSTECMWEDIPCDLSERAIFSRFLITWAWMAGSSWVLTCSKLARGVYSIN